MQSRIKKKKRVKQFGKVKELLRYREDYMKKKYIKNRPKYTCKKCGGIHVGNYEKFLKTYCPFSFCSINPGNWSYIVKGNSCTYSILKPS